MATTLEAPKTAQPAPMSGNMDDVLIFSTSDLRTFVPSPGSRQGDNPLVQFFREVKDLGTLAQLAAKGQRNEVQSGMEAPRTAPSLPNMPGNSGKGGGWSMA